MSEDDTEREWSARALGDLGVSEAVPHLLRALAAADRRGTPPDWSEPVSIRHALAVLGARRVVIPQEIARLQIDDELGPAWPVDVLGDVLRRLADARQVVLYFQYWTRRPEYDPSAWYAVTQTRRGSTRTTGRRLRAMLAEREGRRSGRRIDHATRLGVR
jgi:hypothetical protein